MFIKVTSCPVLTILFITSVTINRPVLPVPALERIWAIFKKTRCQQLSFKVSTSAFEWCQSQLWPRLDLFCVLFGEQKDHGYQPALKYKPLRAKVANLSNLGSNLSTQGSRIGWFISSLIQVHATAAWEHCDSWF